jgi:hypothetical protein
VSQLASDTGHCRRTTPWTEKPKPLRAIRCRLPITREDGPCASVSQPPRFRRTVSGVAGRDRRSESQLAFPATLRTRQPWVTGGFVVKGLSQSLLRLEGVSRLQTWGRVAWSESTRWTASGEDSLRANRATERPRRWCLRTLRRRSGRGLPVA